MLKGDTLPQAREHHHEMATLSFRGTYNPSTNYNLYSYWYTYKYRNVAGTFPLVESLVMSYYKGFGSLSLKLYAKLNLYNIKQLLMIT